MVEKLYLVLRFGATDGLFAHVSGRLGELDVFAALGFQELFLVLLKERVVVKHGGKLVFDGLLLDDFFLWFFFTRRLSGLID